MPISNDIYYFEHLPRQLENPTAVILIHGAGGNHLSWHPDLRRLAHYRTLALDLPGHGQSAGYGEQTIDGYTRWIEKWLDGLNIPRAIIIGHSMGGAIALDFALRFPGRTVALGLFSTGARLPVNPAILDNSSNPATLSSAIEKIIQWSFSPETSQKIIKLTAERIAEIRYSVLYNDLLACQSFDRLDTLSRVTSPTLILCGDQDKMTPLRFSQLLASKIPENELAIIPGAGHMIMLEKPREVWSTLVNFLSALTQPGI